MKSTQKFDRYVAVHKKTGAYLEIHWNDSWERMEGNPTHYIINATMFFPYSPDMATLNGMGSYQGQSFGNGSWEVSDFELKPVTVTFECK
jgi:hypothetical protein